MITITVVSFNDGPLGGTLQAHFDELGGTIGRADTNQLVLPDPERTISRVAAQVVFRNGGFAVVDRGSNPIVVNGRALGPGREAPLGDGDRVRIGGYELSVKAGATTGKATAADPFAELLGPAPAAPVASGPVLIDPLAAPYRAPSAAPPASPAGAPTAAAAAAGIPSDWDPFAPDSVHIKKASAPPNALGLDIGGAAPAALISDLPAAQPSSLDQLFGLGPGSGGDPLANSLLAAEIAKPNMAGDADPIRALKAAPKGFAASESDAVSDLNRPFIPQTVIGLAPPMPAAATPLPPSAPPIAPMPPSSPAAAPVLPSPSGAVMSWDAPPAPTVITAPPLAPAVPMRPVPPPPVAAPVMPAARPARAQGSEAAELLEAFRRGLETPTVNLPALTPELMEQIGQLLKEATAGTVELLAARAAFKRELRAHATTIVPRNNNPLKFSPSGDVALNHLLSPPARGFMAAAPAMRDAYDDLRAHQFAFVAAMQAALEGVLQRFDPAELEAGLTERSLLHTVLPASRKARMWEVFVEHYGRIRTEATDDFHTLFGNAFLKSYEEHIDRLRGPEKAEERAAAKGAPR
ncbi:MAG: type VI secretion system-associated FHA domain protein TagH [Rubrivivax sp.]|nr:type VI secretion system-associated FHA domain protein TagH [Rubrivivax sp.]